MPVYISLLRGINVSGQKKIKMEDLKKLYESLNFSNVLTYIQSGNIIFECKEEKLNVLSKIIEQGIKEEYNFDVKTLIKKPEDLKKILDKNPFGAEKVYVTFLFDVPKNIPLNELNNAKQETEQIEIINDIVYFLCPESYGKTKLSNNFLETKLKIPATTRNWNTVNKLLEMSIR